VKAGAGNGARRAVGVTGPAERLVGAVLQLAAAAGILGLPAAAGDVRALEPAEPCPAAPRCSEASGYGTARQVMVWASRRLAAIEGVGDLLNSSGSTTSMREMPCGWTEGSMVNAIVPRVWRWWSNSTSESACDSSLNKCRSLQFAQEGQNHLTAALGAPFLGLGISSLLWVLRAQWNLHASETSCSLEALDLLT
jgi:hypothetical protein